MCDHCHKEVIEQGILESDLPGLPYTDVKWKCIVPGCRGGSKVRDYGNDPYYFDSSIMRYRIIDGTKKIVRGGWWNLSQHYYLCGRHWKDSERIEQMMRHRFNSAFFLSKMQPIIAKKKR